MNPIPSISPVLGLLALSATMPTIKAQSYVGVGGRFDQQIAAIQRNVPLGANTGSVEVSSTASGRRVFVRFLADTGRNVTGFDINMRFLVLGKVVSAWLYGADAQNRPSGVLASGQVGIGTDMHYCRASFRDAYRVQGSQLYFMAFELPALETLRFGTVAGGTSVTYFVTANGAAQDAQLQFKVNADGFSPRIELQQLFIGNLFTVRCTQAELNRTATLWFAAAGAAPPLDLYGLGAMGSFLYLPSPFAVAAQVGSEPDRSREVTLFMPYVPELRGLAISFQWQVHTPTLPGGFAMSDAAHTTVQ